jgi:DNA-directed RNA polymerase subunit omega
MLHPSYAELMKVVNEEAEGDTPVVNSRYSIVMAAARRARQLIDGAEPLVAAKLDKALSVAVDELNQGKIKILTEEN